MSFAEIQELLEREQELAAEASAAAATADPVDILCAAIDETGAEPPAPPSPPQLSHNASLDERLYTRCKAILVARITAHRRTIRHAREAAAARRSEQAKRVEKKLAIGKGKRMDV